MSEVEGADIFDRTLVYRVGLAIDVGDCIFGRDIAFSDVMSVQFAFFVRISGLDMTAAFMIRCAFIVPSIFIIASRFAFQIDERDDLAYAERARRSDETDSFRVNIDETIREDSAAGQIRMIRSERRAFLRFAAMPDVRSCLFFDLRIRCYDDFEIRTRFFMIIGFYFEDVRACRVEFSMIDGFFDDQTSRRIDCRIDLPDCFRSRACFRADDFIDAARDVGGRRAFTKGLFCDFDFRIDPDFFDA